MTLKRIALLALFVVVVAIQFIRPAPNKAKKILNTDISNVYEIPVPVHAILQNSCYDCHSNNTNYPWYSNIQPVNWWLSSHIREGKAELNFNEFGSYNERRQKSKLKAIAASVEDGSMPLPSYLWIHRAAKLSNNQRKMIQLWTERTLNRIANTNQ